MKTFSLFWGRRPDGELDSPFTGWVWLIGILVHDIEKVSQAYADFFGLDKPQISITDTADIARTEYSGGGTGARAKLAYILWGPRKVPE